MVGVARVLGDQISYLAIADTTDFNIVGRYFVPKRIEMLECLLLRMTMCVFAQHCCGVIPKGYIEILRSGIITYNRSEAQAIVATSSTYQGVEAIFQARSEVMIANFKRLSQILFNRDFATQEIVNKTLIFIITGMFKEWLSNPLPLCDRPTQVAVISRPLGVPGGEEDRSWRQVKFKQVPSIVISPETRLPRSHQELVKIDSDLSRLRSRIKNAQAAKDDDIYSAVLVLEDALQGIATIFDRLSDI